jgi:hypothetical protein
MQPARRCAECGIVFQIIPKQSYCPDCKRKKDRAYQQGFKIEVFAYYSDGCCECCGEERFEFLTIDHIGGGGAVERRTRKALGGSSAAGWNQCRDLKKRGFPAGYQVLCYNCNCAREFSDYCPHQREREAAAKSTQS